MQLEVYLNEYMSKAVETDSILKRFNLRYPEVPTGHVGVVPSVHPPRSLVHSEMETQVSEQAMPIQSVADSA